MALNQSAGACGDETVAPSTAQGNENGTGNETNVRKLRYIEDSSRKVKALSTCSIVLGILICVSDLITFWRISSYCPSSVFSGLWSALLFGVANGALGLRAAFTKPHVSLRFAEVNHIFSMVTLSVHLIPPAMAVCSLLGFPYFYRLHKGNDLHSLTALTFNESGRFALCVLLLKIDIWLAAIFTNVLDTLTDVVGAAADSNALQRPVLLVSEPEDPPAYSTVVQQQEHDI